MGTLVRQAVTALQHIVLIAYVVILFALDQPANDVIAILMRGPEHVDM